MSSSANKFSKSRSEDIGKHLQVRSMNLELYIRVEIYGRVNQIVDPSKFVCDISEAHCSELAKFVRNYN